MMHSTLPNVSKFDLCYERRLQSRRLTRGDCASANGGIGQFQPVLPRESTLKSETAFVGILYESSSRTKSLIGLGNDAIYIVPEYLFMPPDDAS